MRPIATFAWNAFVLGVALVCLATVFGFGGRWWWGFELACNFRVQYFWILLVGVAAFAARRKWRPAAAVAALAGVNLALIAPLYWPVSAAPIKAHELRVVSLNVHARSTAYEQVIQFIRDVQPDVVLFVEVDRDWDQALTALKDELPHSKSWPQDDSFGLALYSRLPLVDTKFVPVGTFGIQAVTATVDVEGVPLHIIGGHPLPPVSPTYLAERNRQLSDLAVLAAKAGRPTILLGDFNVTSWSSFFGDLVRESNLRDSREGFGVQASWPADRWPLRIPIDHCLVSPEIHILDRRLGPNIGSDHLPVIVELTMDREAG